MIANKRITIAELRARNNKMPQSELAFLLGVSQSTVSAWERDVSSITSKDLIKLCNYFNVSSDEILGLNIKNTPTWRF